MRGQSRRGDFKLFNVVEKQVLCWDLLITLEEDGNLHVIYTYLSKQNKENIKKDEKL